VRRALLSVAVALAGAAGVTASGWALQATALPPPKPAAFVAADASVWLLEHRLAVNVFHFEHRRSKGACVRGWFRPRNGTKTHVSVLSFRAGPILRLSGQRRVSVIAARRRRQFPPARLAADAGCTRMLGRALATAAQSGTHLTTERGYAANRAAVALGVRRGREERLTVYVSPRTEAPLVVFVDLDGRKITTRIYLPRVTRRVLEHFRLLHEITPEPKK
jgi:hypothetical protein